MPFRCIKPNCTKLNIAIGVKGNCAGVRDGKPCKGTLVMIKPVAAELELKEVESGEVSTYTLKGSVIKDYTLNFPDGIMSIRRFQGVPFKKKDTVLLVAHGRQSDSTWERKGDFKSYGFMTKKGHSLFRDLYKDKLVLYAKHLEANSQFYVSDQTPGLFVGPHLDYELASSRDSLENVLCLCDVVVVTLLKLAPTADAAYRADLKVPLPLLLASDCMADYENLLVMACRSPWDATGQNASISGAHDTGTGLLYNHTDSVSQKVAI